MNTNVGVKIPNLPVFSLLRNQFQRAVRQFQIIPTFQAMDIFIAQVNVLCRAAISVRKLTAQMSRRASRILVR